MSLRIKVIDVVLTGATGETDTPQIEVGEVAAVALQYTGQSGTCDVVVKTKGEGPPSREILNIPDANADGYWAPRVQADKVDGTDFTNGHVPFVVADKLTVAVTGGSVGSVRAFVFLKDNRR